MTAAQSTLTSTKSVTFWIGLLKGCITFYFQVELRCRIQFYDGIKTSDIHETVIKAAADLISHDAPDYRYLAARLAVFHLRKKPTARSSHRRCTPMVKRMVEMGKYDNHLLEGYR
ncbi:ATP cone domain-containing protein [Shigella flexneri]